MSDDIPCNNCGVKFSDVEQLRKDAYDSDQDFWRMNELFIKTQTQLKEAEIRCNTKDATIEYLEQFVKFCKSCKNPEDDCLCD